MTKLTLIVHDIRSTHNVGSLLRTADCLGVDKVFLTGYTPYPPKNVNDARLPHEQLASLKAISKTALGAEKTVDWEQNQDVETIINELKKQGYTIVGLEQTKNALILSNYKPPKKIALVLGSEVTGISEQLLEFLDYCVEIPMRGRKESLNVAQAATIAMYHCKYVV